MSVTEPMFTIAIPARLSFVLKKKLSYRISWKSDRRFIRWYYVTGGGGCHTSLPVLLRKEGLKTRTCVWSTANSSQQNVITHGVRRFTFNPRSRKSTPRIILAGTDKENGYTREASLLKRPVGELRVTVPRRYSIPTGNHHQLTYDFVALPNK